MNKCFELKFELQSYWHVGSGRQAGVYADHIVHKSQSLPVIPGSAVKGLLADAFSQAQQNGWFGDIPVKDVLFGIPGNDGISCQGLLSINSAQLGALERDYLQQDPKLCQHLYKTLSATQLNENGVAESGHLRTIEVCVPVTLFSEISINLEHPNINEHHDWLEQDFAKWLAASCALISSLGAKRHRGLGKVIVSAVLVAELGARS